MTPRLRDAWDAALHIIEKLRANGHVALLAGGCVRDRLLGCEPKDYDVATDATPTRVGEIFPKAREVGVKFGVMLVRKFGQDIEVATFRSDGTYSDGRHPDRVTFGSEVEDARRRDFTINGLFLDPMEDRVIDHVGGRDDLEARIIRTIGDPDRRFTEDHLRLLRAVRFASRLSFTIEATTLDAIQRHCKYLESISAERVWMELEAILTAPSRADGWDLLCRTGLRKHLAKPWTPDVEEDAAVRHRIALLPDRAIPPTLALAAALCSREPANVRNISRTLRLSNQQRKAVLWLVRSLPLVREESSLELADLKLLLANENREQLLELLRIDLAAANADMTPSERVRERAAEISPADIAPKPLLSGDDLAAIGIEPGPELGELLAVLYRAQLNERISTREQALAMAKSRIRSR
ncbi:MAG: CCA tRNA nucleotidyltransferase [Planctomycetota bacterium]|jgi:poly(A) polymerase